MTISPPAPAEAEQPPPVFTVTTVSGERMVVLTEAEARWYERTRADYDKELRFTETTDLRDLDRVLLLELLIFRWGQHLAAGGDYDGFEVDEDKLRMQLRQFSDQLTKIKESMGLAKRVRDAATAEGNFAAYIADLRLRARTFGYHRTNQLQEALALMNDISAVVGVFTRCDKEEREKIGYESEKDIVDWIRADVLPKYHQIDAYFRENEQRMWQAS